MYYCSVMKVSRYFHDRVTRNNASYSRRSPKILLLSPEASLSVFLSLEIIRDARRRDTCAEFEARRSDRSAGVSQFSPNTRDSRN